MSKFLIQETLNGQMGQNPVNVLPSTSSDGVAHETPLALWRGSSTIANYTTSAPNKFDLLLEMKQSASISHKWFFFGKFWFPCIPCSLLIRNVWHRNPSDFGDMISFSQHSLERLQVDLSFHMLNETMIAYDCLPCFFWLCD